MRTSDIPTISGEFPSGTQVLALVEVEPGVKRMRLGPVPVGPEGTIGPQGPAGPQGIQGEHGHIGAVGPQGPQGIQGVQGPQGEQGATGATGPAGMGFTIRGEWNGTDEYYVDDVVTVDGSSYGSLADGNINHAVTDYTWWCLLASGGVQGPQGIQGVQGIQGPAGAAGSAGADGPQGTQNANLVYAGPASGSAATPGFRALIAADLPATREFLTANRTYYVATTGSDSNNGLTVGAPFATIMKAMNVIGGLDVGIYAVTVQLADGTYTEAVIIPRLVGAGSLKLTGNATTPGNVVICGLNGTATVRVSNGGTLILTNLELRGHATGAALLSVNAFSVCDFGGITFGSGNTAHYQLQCYSNSTARAIANYKISGSHLCHVHCSITANLFIDGMAVTFVGTPAFSLAFVVAQIVAYVSATSMTFIGTPTGKRYEVRYNATLNTNGGGANYFPGNSAGSVDTGGQYI